MSARPQYDQVSVPLASVRAPAVVTAANLSKRYGQGDAQVEALCDVSLEIEEGRLTAIMGPSGSGKSTLMHILAGLDQPSEGTVSIAGVEISSMSDAELTKLRRRHIGFVFQFYNLLPVLSAQRNVELPLLLTNLGAAERGRRAEIALTLVGLRDRARHKPRELSGGQEQRVAIARAIVSDPVLLVCDEPTGDLDRATAHEIMLLLQALNRDHGKTVVMVTHDPKAAEYARRRLRLDKGTLAESNGHEAA